MLHLEPDRNDSLEGPMTTLTQSPHAPPAVGTVAPDFTLPSTSGERVTLSQLRGKQVLIAFFPLAFSPTCTAELCEMRDDWDDFIERGLVVLPISVDSTYSLKEYKQKYSLKVDLLSDFKREVTNLYGVLNQDRFFSNRAYFLIDRDGIVRWAHVEENPSLKRSNQEILAEVDRVT
jgi:peroxiredoxin